MQKYYKNIVKYALQQLVRIDSRKFPPNSYNFIRREYRLPRIDQSVWILMNDSVYTLPRVFSSVTRRIYISSGLSWLHRAKKPPAPSLLFGPRLHAARSRTQTAGCYTYTDGTPSCNPMRITPVRMLLQPLGHLYSRTDRSRG